jgi:hypothetical protein
VLRITATGRKNVEKQVVILRGKENDFAVVMENI